ncbi:putative ML-like domain, transient receptor potential channel Flc/Pkd2 [Septoria linicola]|nr:putative ML-like domain, transient receptor potential channel Flc/Pkd2 [Septoria linicola]
MITRIWTSLLALLLACLCHPVTAADRWFNYQQGDGTTVVLNDNRQPALYTEDFGDCLGSSTINVTRFDVAYYKDNMTILWHMAGETGVADDDVMMSIGVYAYGENRFELIFNPCDANIRSLCPLNSSLPIAATAIIPVSAEDVAAIIPLALTIPDFEGEAILRIFSNTTRTEIACYSAVVTNGASFSHPAAVGTVLGLFTLVAVIASFATAVYGEAVPTMRLHYAHSLSVGVVFAVWQHIFFSGAVSVNWASVLPAWWSNFAWAGGMIYTQSMQSNLNSFIGNDLGNTSQVGAAQSGSPNLGIGGGFDLASIYKRALSSGMKRATSHPLYHDLGARIYGRQAAGETSSTDSFSSRDDGYQWYGDPVQNGLPLPGNYSGFAGTLGAEGISASTAFLTGFLWFLIILVILTASVMAFKWLLEGLIRLKWVKADRLKFFRDRWLGYSAVVALRICYIGFFAMMFLSIFQFTYLAASGAQGIAAIVFIVFFLGMPAAALYAVWYKKAMTGSTSGKVYEHKMLMSKIPFPKGLGKKSPETSTVELQPGHAHTGSKSSTVPLWKRMVSAEKAPATNAAARSIHDDDDYIKKFGWLAARFRRTRWWFFTAWLFYEFIRAVFYGGASGYPQAQVFGLLVIELIAFGLIIWMRPYEGQRLNVLVVYCLGFSKVATVALSAAFDVRYNLPRIPTTVIGIVIIVIQGILTVITMIAIVVGAVSSYMSVMRNTEDFRPRRWYKMRERYFDHLDRTVNDVPRPPKVKKSKEAPEETEEAKVGFEMKNVKRVNKIEDEDKNFQSEIAADPNHAFMSAEDLSSTAYGKRIMTPNRSRANSRAASVASQSMANLPYGARSNRPSWSTRDFQRAGFESQDDLDMSQTAVGDDSIEPVTPNKRHSGMSSKAPALRAMPSNGSLRVGAEVSSTDAIGVVPVPKVRPRAGTMGSIRSARRISGNFGDIPEAAYSTDHLDVEIPPIPSQYSSQRNSHMSQQNEMGESSSRPNTSHQHFAQTRGMPLTPAQEHEEWDLKLTKTNSKPQ